MVVKDAIPTSNQARDKIKIAKKTKNKKETEINSSGASSFYFPFFRHVLSKPSS